MSQRGGKALIRRDASAQTCRFFTDEVLRTVEHVGLAQPDVVDLSSLLESRTSIKDRLRGMGDE